MIKSLVAAASVVLLASFGMAQQKMPEVGIKPIAPDQYKPVSGKVGGRFVADTLGEPKSFNPVTAGETSTTEYTNRMFEGLTDVDPFTGDIVPKIAEKWTVSEDGLTWTVSLRKDVKFNDNTTLTAKDVVFTWNELIYDKNRPEGAIPRWPCSMRDIVTFEGKIVDVKALDDYTVQFVLPVKNATWTQSMGTEILPEHKYGKAAREGTFGGVLGADSKPEDIVGSGPYMLGWYTRGQQVVLTRNPNYWKKDADGTSYPYIEQRLNQVTKDQNVMLLNFEQGNTDVFGLSSGKDVARLKPKQKEGNFSLYQFGPDEGTLFVGFNMNSDAAKAGKIPAHKIEWFRDRRFRQAISYAIDRDAQIRNVRRNLGYSQPAPYTLAPGPLKQDGFAPHPFDPAKSKALLAEMGFKPGPKGTLVDAKGNELSFTINTNAGNNIREETANFIRKDLESIGIKVNVLFLEFNLLVEKIDVTFDWECLIMGFTGGREPHFGANFWKSNANLHLWWPEQKTPSFDWEKRIDEIFEAGIKELDPVKRKAIYREWIDIVYLEQPVIYLTVGERVTALRNRFGNVFPAPVGTLGHNDEQFFVLSEK